MLLYGESFLESSNLKFSRKRSSNKSINEPKTLEVTQCGYAQCRDKKGRNEEVNGKQTQLKMNPGSHASQ